MNLKDKLKLMFKDLERESQADEQMINAISQLFKEEMLEMIDKASPLDEDHEYDPTDEMLIESYKHNLREAINNK